MSAPLRPAGETLARRWLRRALTIPGFALLLGLLLALTPLALPLLALGDLARGARLATARTWLYLLCLLALELAGLAGALWLWLAVREPQAFLRANARLQGWWARALFRAALRIFSARAEALGAEALAGGPLVLLVRHASAADTLLPVVYGAPLGLAFRYVLKRALLWDPCLDVVGQRIPNAFVTRGADPEGDLEALRALAAGAGPHDALVIFPEGTRATPERRARLLEALERKGDAEALARARRLRHVLPPRLGGVLALLDAAPAADVVVCAHRGLEGMRTVRHFAAGGLVGATLRIGFRRVPRAQIPEGRAARAAWLQATWEEVDRFTAGAGPAAAS